MKKLIYQILIIAIVLGSIGSIPAIADDYSGHLQEAAIDYVLSEGLWTAGGEFAPDQAATRAQVASVMARYLSQLRPPYAGNFSDVDASGIYAGDITLATNLGLVSGSNGAFRPDENITREEFAAMVVRAYDIAGHEIFDTNYATELIIDYDSISDWAKKSVTDALGNGLMVGQAKKKFNPAGTVTRAELAAAVYSMYYAEDKGLAYSEKIVTSPNLDGFKVFNTGIYTARGIGGFGIIAEYGEGGPREIYVKRNKVPIQVGATGGNNMGDTVSYVRVTDPNGDVICRVSLDWLDSGVMEKMITIPEGPAGIYQIQIVNGNMNANSQNSDGTYNFDTFSVGIKGARYWGFRGEDFIRLLDYSIVPKNENTGRIEGYIYVPEKVDFLTIGEVGSPLRLYADNGTGSYNNEVLYVHTVTTGVLGANDTIYAHPEENDSTLPALVGDAVYRFEFQSDLQNWVGYSNGHLLALNGISPVVYESAEAAWALKSGYTKNTDDYASLQLAGPLQKRARERMIEIYEEMKAQGNENFAFGENEIERLPRQVEEGDLDNFLAEISLFGTYGASVSFVQASMDTQCLDPSNPWFGAILSRNTIPYDSDGDGETDRNVFPEWTGEFKTEDYPFYKAGTGEVRNWQTAHYAIGDCKQPFAGAISINGEFNPYYNNPTLVKRAELVLLYLVTQTPSDGMIVQNSYKGTATGDRHMYENFLLGDRGLAQAYRFMRDYLSPETRAITDTAVLNNVDKVMNFRGGGMANQLLMNYAGLAWTYDWSGIEFYHKQLKNNIMKLTQIYKYLGMSEIGYFMELFGADGNGGSGYGGMSEGMWGEIVYAYLSMPEARQDPALKAEIIRLTELNQMWDSYFYTPKTANFEGVNSNNWTTRTDSTSGTSGTNDGKWLMRHIFPRAKKNMIVSQFGAEWEDEYQTTANRKNIQSKHFLNDASAIQAFNPGAGRGNTLSSYQGYYYKAITNCNIENCTELHYDKKGIGHGGMPESYRSGNSLGYFVRHRDQQFNDSQMPLLPFELKGDNNIVKTIVDDDGVVAIKHKGIYMLMYFNNGWQRSPDMYNPTAINGHFSAKSWMGGGPIAVWDDYFATTLVARKPNNYEKFTGNGYSSDYTVSEFVVDDIKHSAIVGTDKNGRIFISGKEDSKFSWIDEGKNFMLSGQQLIIDSEGSTIQDKIVTWKYYLTENGIAIDGGLENIESGDDMYMMLPVLVQKGATYTFDQQNSRLVIEHNGNQMVYRWKEGSTVSLGAASTDTENANNFKYLKIKLSTNSNLATVWIERTMAS